MRAIHVTKDGDSYHCEETGEDWTEPPMFTIVPPEPFEDWPETGDPNHTAPTRHRPHPLDGRGLLFYSGHDKEA